jgi:formate dehydrogenase gamma subunit
MSLAGPTDAARPVAGVRTERTFQRFTAGQRWEHLLLVLTFTVLLLTGLPQKYRAAGWSQQILATPERLALARTVHHVAALILTLEVLYHAGRGVALLARRQLPSAIFPDWQDVRDAWQMLRYLLFLSRRKPAFGKYNFEQKFTYWFLFFALAIMVVTGFVLWFPVEVTRALPGGVVPAAKLAHSTEAVVAAIFVVIWHFYHVHVERLNLSIFTGRLGESDMREYHSAEYRRLAGPSAESVDRSEQA